jgi:hypothetical protein
MPSLISAEKKSTTNDPTLYEDYPPLIPPLIGGNRLTAKLAAEQLTSLEPRPEDDFGLGHRAAELLAFVSYAFAVRELIHSL